MVCQADERIHRPSGGLLWFAPRPWLASYQRIYSELRDLRPPLAAHSGRRTS